MVCCERRACETDNLWREVSKMNSEYLYRLNRSDWKQKTADELLVDEPKEVDPDGIDQHTPGAKLDARKPFAGILADFGLALTAVAEVGTFGAKKYSRGGWQHVSDGYQRYSDAMWRHLLRSRYDDIDEDSGLDHDAQVAWNALARLELKIRERFE